MTAREMKHSNFARGVAFATVLQLLSCGPKTPPTTAMGSNAPISDRVLIQTKDLPDGLDLRITEGKQGPPAYDRARLAPAQKLADADTQQLLARATPIKVDADDQQAFALRAKSLPPPRTGQVITGQFPAPASTLLPPRATDAGQDLRVLRYMPEGAVPLAPELSVTFSHPMVAVTSQDDAARIQPVKLTPTPPGRWRWIGTRTILFDPQVRFPQATTYTAVVPAGTKASGGETSKAAVTWTFETPPPTANLTYPDAYQMQRLDAPMFVRFDQRIDPAAALASIHVTANGAALPLRLLDAAEIAKDKQVAALVAATKQDEQDGRWLAFRATRPFPQDTQVDVELAAGMPSAEGPNKTKAPQHYTFRTYPPLRIDRSECGWGGECHPNMPFQIIFNNPIDGDAFDEASLTVTPAIPGLHVQQNGQVITLAGLTTARTTYKVGLAGKLVDEFGQTLGRDTTLTFAVGDAEPTFFGPNGMVVVDPSARKPTLDFFTTNYDDLNVRIYKVTPDDYDQYGRYLRERWNHDKPPTLPGTKVFDKLVATTKGGNRLVESSVDVSPAMRRTPSGAWLGNAIVVVEPSPWKQSYPAPQMIAWVQSTRLGLDAYLDHEQLVAFATDLATGAAAPGVKLELHPFKIAGTTDGKGLATLALGAGGPKGAHFLTATRGDDVAFLTDNSYYSEYGSWVRSARPTQLAWYVIDDRKMYKPGEEVSLKGWLRAIDHGKNGDVGGLGGAVTSVTYKVRDAQGNQLATGAAAVRTVARSDARPTVLRMSDEAETAVNLASPDAIGAEDTPGGGLTMDVGADELHAAQPRRLRVRQLGAVVGLSFVRGRRRRPRVQAGEGVEPDEQDRRDRRAHGAPRLPVRQADDADGGRRERQRHGRQPPDVERVGGDDRASVARVRRDQDEEAVRRQGRAVRPRRHRGRSRRQGAAGGPDRAALGAARLRVQARQVHAEGGRPADVRRRRGEGPRAVLVRDQAGRLVPAHRDDPRR
ncbi:MAG: Ig-like domain-containing protein [Proteobacteria bacterium]|nr:Ig-like domain-containing protein [Pseudomonadota bacterium]